LSGLSPGTYVNLMDQYRPAGRVSDARYAEINRRVNGEELENAYAVARASGLHRFDAQP